MGTGETLREFTTLRFTTSGSVDDGKSTLIGRLLLDSKVLLEDQLAAVARTTARNGADGLDLSLFTDGLTAEREQGITIDVAWRYFATPRRRFIIADTPGHEQYTRNMVTGASTASLSIVLADAARGLATQTRRHAAIASLLAIPHVILAVNKMDLAGWSRERFDAIAGEFAGIARSLGLARVTAIPLSALEGDMVVSRGENLSWYAGPTLLEALEAASPVDPVTALRFPVQLVSRSRFGEKADRRAYLGRVESGTIAVGDTVVVRPSGVEAKVAEIVTLEGTLEAAGAGRSLSVVLDRQVDVARGDILTHRHDAPAVARRFTARLAWLDRDALVTGRRYWLKQGTKSVRATVDDVLHRLDLASLTPDASAQALEFNDLGLARLTVASPLAVDPYRANRHTGSFVLIDDATHRTVAGGMVEEVARD
jgi:sulfate adenylyltransferase subunit 1